MFWYSLKGEVLLFKILSGAASAPIARFKNVKMASKMITKMLFSYKIYTFCKYSFVF